MISLLDNIDWKKKGEKKNPEILKKKQQHIENELFV